MELHILNFIFVKGIPIAIDKAIQCRIRLKKI